MTVVEMMVMRGRRLIAARRLIAPAALILSVAAVLLARPFTIAHHNLWLTASSVALGFVGLALRASALPFTAKDGELPGALVARGIYSAMRFPALTGGLLMLLSLALYTGVLWFALGALLFYLPCALCMAAAREEALLARYGASFEEWCRTTGALFPRMGSLRHGRVAAVGQVWRQMPSAFALTGGLCVIEFLKNIEVDFSVGISLGWLLALGVTAVAALLSRIMSR